MNNFQLVLAYDDCKSFAVFNYGELEWTRGLLSDTDAVVRERERERERESGRAGERERKRYIREETSMPFKCRMKYFIVSLRRFECASFKPP